MQTSPTLTTEDAASIIRLLGEVCALEGEHEQKKTHLMDGLCRLIDADYWAWALAAELVPGKFPVYVGVLNGGFEEAQFAEFLQIQAHPEMVKWTVPLATELRTSNRHVTRNVQDQFNYQEFINSEVGRWWTKADVQPRCIAFHPLADGSTTGVGIYRRAGRPLFTPRECRIAHILLTEVPWLHAMGWPEDKCASIPTFSPRIWLVHEMLLQGFSRKDIAQHLDLSLATANGYVKDIFNRLGVHSQVQLIARFRVGDGGDLVMGKSPSAS